MQNPNNASTRRRWTLLIAYAVLLTPAIVIGALQALQANNNSPLEWVAPDFPPRADYDEFCAAFGPGDVAVASWPGCTLSEGRLDRLVEVLRTDRRFYLDGRWAFHSVTSGREATLAMTAPGPTGKPAMTLDEAIDRLRPSLVGPDRATTAVVVTFTKEGLARRAELVELLRSAIRGIAGVADSDIHLAGPVIDGLSVDEASQRTLSRFAGPSSLVVFLLSWACLRSLRAASVVFGIAAFCQAATLALVHYCGDSMSALLIVLPPMVQVLAVATGLHLANYYFDSDRSGEDAAIDALRHGWGPCALSAATTVAGMSSLVTSELTPIRQFGVYAAAGVALSAGLLLALLPAALAWIAPSRRAPWRAPRGRVVPSLFSAPAWASMLRRHHALIVVSSLIAIALGGFYATKVTTSVRIETLFPAGSRVREDYAWIERNVAPLVPLDVIVHFPQGSASSPAARLALLWRLGESLKMGDLLGPPVSASTVAAPWPDLSLVPEAARQSLLDGTIAAQRPLLSKLGLTHDDGDGEHWRLTVRTSAMGSADYGALLAGVRAKVESALATENASLSERVSVNVTGVMPLVHRIQGQLLDDLIASFAGALVLITVTMTLAQAGVRAGLLAMASNVFPIALYFGWLGWRGQPIDIGVVMTASVALGIAVDDTLHYLSFFRRAVEEGSSRFDAVREALARCAPAMIQTSVTCGLGLLVFALSDFAPTRGFAISMAVLLGLALAGDLLLLPALLVGPFGAVCARDTAAATDEDELRASAA